MSQTVYLPIKLSDAIPQKVGVFISDHFSSTADVNFIVYFHGHIISACQTDTTLFKSKGIEYYWGTPFFQCLRDDLTASKANAMLVAPTFVPKLGSGDPGSFGDLGAVGKFDFLINQTVAKLKDSGTLPATARIGKIILSGHSAGGLPMMKILGANNVLKPNIVECWGFECLYFGTDGWKTWLSANPGKTFRHVRQPSEQKDPVAKLKPMENFFDVPNGTNHCHLVKENWREAIDNSGTLRHSDEIA